MSSFILMNIPTSLDKYQKHLAEFFEGMIMKLDKNSHKDTPTLKTVPEIISLLRDEIDEFNEQFHTNKEDPNALKELYDIANFALLAFIALKRGNGHGSND